MSLPKACPKTEADRLLAETAEDHSSQAMALTAHAACAQGWRMIAAVEEGVRPATRQHGCVVVARVGEQIVVPTDARAYAVLTWIYVHEDGNVIFREGEYDLTREKALARFANRSKLTEKALASNFASVLGS